VPNERLRNAPGRFWFADEPERVVPGHLDLSGRWPRVELLGALSPIVEERPSDNPGVRVFGMASARSPRVVHGEIMGPYRRVTLLDARSRRHSTHRMNAAMLLRGEGLQEETLEGSHAIVGAHVRDRDARFTAARFRIVSQDAWANLNGIEMEHFIDGPDKGQTIFKHAPPDPVIAELAGGSGTLSLTSHAIVAPPRVAGAYILTTTWLQIDDNAGLTLDAVTRRFVMPTSALLTMLYAEDCPPIAIAVKDPTSGDWCDVYMPGLVEDPTDVRSPKLPSPPLLSRTDLGLDRLAAWFPLVERLTPLPQLVAGATDARSRTVQNLFLELATAAEGVHRRLYPDSRRLSEAEKAEALQAIAEMELDSPARTILCQAMDTYLWDLSYPMRLKALGADVANAVPGVTGKTTKWSSAVVNARNGFAHWLTGNSSDDEVFAYDVLHNSLRWLLIGRLLLELGVPAETLAGRFAEFEPYRRFMDSARRTLPRVYPEAAAAS
jgi:hypothetical protein